MLVNRNNLINSTNKEKLTYELWLENYKKKHCQQCLIGIPNPTSCCVCYQQSKTGFCCSICSCSTYYSDTQICGGLYDTGSCFCANCQELIKKHLESRNCSCEFSLAGFSVGHSIHHYRLTINGLIKPFFKGSKLWIKLVCRSCEKLIKTFKLDCSCYLEQKKHSHWYNSQKCLNCVIGLYAQPLPEGDLKKKYKQYCQIWQEKAEIQAEVSIKRSYKYDGISYWAECSFCAGEIRGKQKDKEPLSRNKVSFWTGKEADERIICNACLRENKKVIKGLNIRGSKRQMLYNYRLRGII
jgi:hypothetical protein